MDSMTRDQLADILDQCLADRRLRAVMVRALLHDMQYPGSRQAVASAEVMTRPEMVRLRDREKERAA